LGIPKSSILIGFSIIAHGKKLPAIGDPFMETPICGMWKMMRNQRNHAMLEVGGMQPTMAGWWFGTFFSIIYGIILPIDQPDGDIYQLFNISDGHRFRVSCHDFGVGSH
jgi:hypothetical protein